MRTYFLQTPTPENMGPKLIWPKMTKLRQKQTKVDKFCRQKCFFLNHQIFSHYAAIMNTKTQSLNHLNTTSQPKGFSLIEVLVVVAIIGILAGISGTALMKWLPEANLKRAARTIVSMCQDARVEAIKRNQQINFSCNSAANTCVASFTNGTALRQFDLSNIGSGVRLSNSLNTTFTSRGRALTPGIIPITNNAASTLSVTVRTSGSIITN